MLRPGQGILRQHQSPLVAAASCSTVQSKQPLHCACQMLQPSTVADLFSVELQPPQQVLLTGCLLAEAGCTSGRALCSCLRVALAGP